MSKEKPVGAAQPTSPSPRPGCNPWASLAGTLLAVVALAATATVMRDVGAAPPARAWLVAGTSLAVIARDSGRAVHRIDAGGEIRAFALDPSRDRAWVLVGAELRAYSKAGDKLGAFVLDVPAQGRVALAANGQGVWLADDSAVLLVNDRGAVVSSRAVRGPLVDISPNEDHSALWVLTTEELLLLDQQARALQQLSLLSSGALRALSYDPLLKQVWVLSDLTVQRYTWEGVRTFAKTDSALAPFTDIAADLRGGLWARSGRELIHLAADGRIGHVTLAWGRDERASDMAVDPHDRSVWLVSRETLRYFSPDGILFAKLHVPRVGRSLSPRLALDTDAAPIGR